MKNIIEQMKKYFYTVRPKKKYYIPMFILSFTIALLGAFSAWILALIITNLTERDFEIVLKLFIFSFFLQFIFRGLCALHAYFYTLNKNYNIRTIYNKILRKTESINDDFYTNHSHGYTINLLINETETISVFTNQITHALAQVFQSIVLIGIIFSVNIIIGFIAIIAAIICVWIKNYFITKESEYSKKIIQTKDYMISELTEITSANYEIKSMNIIDKINNKFYTHNEKKIKLDNTKTIYNTLTKQFTPILEHIFQYIIMAIIIYLLYLNKSEIDIYVVITGYYASLVYAFNDCMDFVALLKENDISVTRLNEFLNYKDNVSKDFGDKKCTNFNNLSFKDVSFQYENRGKSILNDITCNFEKGNLIALTGENGAGKTTLLKIILGVLKPNKGAVLLNNDSIYSYNFNEYMNSISLVNQNPYFFHKSIKENLNFICEDENKIIDICKKVGIHDFIMTLPEKYDTILTEDAFNISGGQKQKLALARALLKNSQIILLDEFTSSMDIESVERIYSLLQNIKKHHIIIIITHKKNEIQLADVVYCLNESGIKEVTLKD